MKEGSEKSARPPRRGYAICTGPRSGSEFLCEILRSTGALGNPLEQFMSRRQCRACEADPQLLERLVDRGATPNGIYGLKVLTHQFDNSLKSNWPRRLPGLHYVYLQRRDMLGQAISLVRARQTGQYFSLSQARGTARYDGAALGSALRGIAAGQARWQLFFARNGIAPLWLVHEEVRLDPQRAAEAVAAHLGLAGQPQVDLSRIRIRPQADALSEEWRARFVAEHGDTSYLDYPLGRTGILLQRAARDAWRRIRRVPER